MDRERITRGVEEAFSRWKQRGEALFGRKSRINAFSNAPTQQPSIAGHIDLSYLAQEPGEHIDLSYLSPGSDDLGIRVEPAPETLGEYIDLSYLSKVPDDLGIVVEPIREVSIEGCGVTIEEAVEEAQFYQYLEKKGVNEKIADLPIDGPAKELLTNMGGSRDFYHCSRLLSAERTPIERDFGLATIKYMVEVMSELRGQDWDEANEINDTIRGEGMDTMMWWTYAPYLHALLTSKGVEERKSFGIVVNWARTGRVDAKNRNLINLKGLEGFNRNGVLGQPYMLSLNPQGPSHILTKHVAEQIVDLQFMDS